MKPLLKVDHCLYKTLSFHAIADCEFVDEHAECGDKLLPITAVWDPSECSLT